MTTTFKKMKVLPREFSSVASSSGLDPSVDSMRPTWCQCKELPESWSCLETQMLLSVKNPTASLCKLFPCSLDGGQGAKQGPPQQGEGQHPALQ